MGLLNFDEKQAVLNSMPDGEAGFLKKWGYWQLIGQVEQAVLAKLAAKDLPEPTIWTYEAYEGWWPKPEVGNMTDGEQTKTYTEEQLHQAFAQGAASQLSAQPTAWLSEKDCYSTITTHQKETNMFQLSDEFLAGHTIPLYELKESQ